MYDVCLVLMPFANIHTPGLGVSLLKEELSRNGIKSKIFYENIRFAEEVGIKNYLVPDYYGVFAMAGEWAFAELAGFKPGDHYIDIVKKYSRGRNFKNDTEEETFRRLKQVKENVPDFVESAARNILLESPKVVASSSLFQQNNASFALLKRIKELDPSVLTVMGGCNCALDMGEMISRELAFIDFVFSGEGDDVFAEFCKNIMKYGKDCSLEILPDGIFKDGKSRNMDVPSYHITDKLAKVPIPDFSDYFNYISTVSVGKRITVSLPIEGSRGCWWKEKHPCTFCGLGNVHEKYRDKETKQLVKEINYLTETYQVHRYTFCDSILSNRHIKELPQSFNNNDNTRFFCEIKSNMDKTSIHQLRKMGFSMLQPGIESLQDDYLKLMKKGNTAISHVAVLKHARSYGLLIQWNLLLGFPGEKEEYVQEMIDLFPKISHLQPPKMVNHITYQKNSVYCNDPEKYSLVLQPMPAYSYVYGGNKKIADGLAYNFEPVSSMEQEIYYDIRTKGETYKRLKEMSQNWNEDFFKNQDRLTMVLYKDKIEILDYRKSAKKYYYTLDSVKMDIYLAADEPIPRKRVNESLKSKYSCEQIDTAMRFLLDHDLIIEMNGKILSLANEITGYSYEWGKENPAGWLEID